MIDHVYISVTDIKKSLAFYLEALKPLGWRELGNYDAAAGPASVPDLYGLGDATYVSGTGVGSSIWLRQRTLGETGLYLGIVCESNEAVDAAYAAAISSVESTMASRPTGHTSRPVTTPQMSLTLMATAWSSCTKPGTLLPEAMYAARM